MQRAGGESGRRGPIVPDHTGLIGAETTLTGRAAADEGRFNHREQKDVVTVDKVELNGYLDHAIVRSRTAQYTIFCQDIPEISCLQLHGGEKHPFNLAGKVLYISDANQPNDVARLENVTLTEWFPRSERTAWSGVDETRVLLQESVDFDFSPGGEVHAAIYDDGKDETCG